MRPQYAENWFGLVEKEKASVREGFFEEMKEQSKNVWKLGEE